MGSVDGLGGKEQSQPEGSGDSSESQWPSGTNSAPQRSTLGPVLFNVCINEIEKVLRASSADLQLSGELTHLKDGKPSRGNCTRKKWPMGISGGLARPSTRACAWVRVSAQAGG